MNEYNEDFSLGEYIDVHKEFKESSIEDIVLNPDEDKAYDISKPRRIILCAKISV